MKISSSALKIHSRPLEYNFHNSQFHHLQLNWTCELSSNNSFEFELREPWVTSTANWFKVLFEQWKCQEWIEFLCQIVKLIESIFGHHSTFQNIRLNQIIPLWIQRSCQQALNNQKNAKKKSSHLHFHWSHARVNGSWRYFISYAKSWRDGKTDWTFMSFQKCSDWKTSGIFEGFIGNFKTLLRISSSRRIHILYLPHTNFCFFFVFITMIFPLSW